MIEVLLAIAAFIVTIGILVTFHEYGHFVVARGLGFKVLRFSVGFGKPLYRWKGRTPSSLAVPGAPEPAATEYWLSSIPLGGYVKLLDEREGPVPAAERHMAFNRRPIPHRIAVLAAGPGFNFLFAILAYWLMFVTGVPSLKAFVGEVIAPDSAAATRRPGFLRRDSRGRRTAHAQRWESATPLPSSASCLTRRKH